MKIGHIAMWSKDIEKLKNFYVDYFGGTAGNRYINSQKQFESYFITFDSGAKLELMQKPTILERYNDGTNQYIGLVHIAFSVGNKATVDKLTEVLRKASYTVTSEPRTTGDGYYESCVLDPDGNIVEVTE
jgi:lactoylglutathione lyase